MEAEGIPPMLTIHGRINSINVQKVVLACEELKLSYVRHDAGGAFGIVQTDAYKAMNPNSLVPVLIDGDLVLWESNAIVRYLAAKYGAGSLWPTDPALRALSDRWMDWQTTNLSVKMHAAFWGLIRTPVEKQDAAAIAASTATTETAMAILDAALAGKTCIAADHVTMGDLALLAAVFRWLNLPLQRQSRPNVEAWYARMMARPGYGNALKLPIT
jgi:glutathione S-transferase